MNYSDVIRTVKSMARRGWSVHEIGSADGYPLFALTHEPTAPTKGATIPSILIDAGIHGEEPAAVVGLQQWLADHAEVWLDQFRFTIFPCLNPWGFERGIRYAADGNDLNRQFDAPRHPAVQAFRDQIANQQFDFFLDLHEDCDFTAMYLYEVIDPAPTSDGPTLGRRILDLARPDVALADKEKVDTLETADGMISVPFPREEARDFEHAPIALYVYAHHAPHTVTVETPGLLALSLRAELHVRAIQETCRYFSGEGSR